MAHPYRPPYSPRAVQAPPDVVMELYNGFMAWDVKASRDIFGPRWDNPTISQRVGEGLSAATGGLISPWLAKQAFHVALGAATIAAGVQAARALK